MDIRTFIFQRFIPRILSRLNIKRKETSGYPNLLKNKADKTIVPRKRIIGNGDAEESMEVDLCDCSSLPCREVFRIKAPDKIIRMIPRQRGNNPGPPIRKVPTGILNESRVVIPPNRNMTTPTMISSLFTGFSVQTLIDHCELMPA